MTGVDITAAAGKPYIKSPDDKFWGKTSVPFMAHGYEVLVTPLHMLMLYNAVANNGKMMKPYLVNSIREHGVDVQTFSPQVVVDRIASDETLRQVRECMRAVVDSPHGTGFKILHDSVYSISGKSGTAVTANNNQGYVDGKKKYQSSFLGFFPSDNPKYSVAVVIQNSKKSKLFYGADCAGRVFKAITDQVYRHYLSHPSQRKSLSDTVHRFYYGTRNDMKSILENMNIVFNDGNDNGVWREADIHQEKAGLKISSRFNTPENMVPDVKGMGLKDALYLLENKGLIAMASGKGKIVKQSPEPGTNFKKGQKIILMLN
jgi:cell division protein FtsI (penicillin-binding protein 3)